MYYVNQRWLGGMLTNYNTIKGRIKKLEEYNKMEEDGSLSVLPKKEVATIRAEREKLARYLNGIKDMDGMPQLIFVVDPKKEKIAINEAKILGIPVVGLVDTNCDPDEVDIAIPGNDDAIRAVKLITETLANAVIEGKQGKQEHSEEKVEEKEEINNEENQEVNIAINEAKILGIPVVGLVDTNCDPDEVDIAIPGNDDAIRAVKLITETLANAVIEGKQGKQEHSEEKVEEKEEINNEENQEVNMAISAQLIKELREKTGAGMMDCKKVLVETDGDIDKAIDLLREKGLASAEKKASRIASEGLVASYIHSGRIGVLVEVNSETDFVAKTDEFKEFVKDIAMQVAASNPEYLCEEDVPQEAIDKEKEVLIQQAINEGKPQNIAEKMVEGRMHKFYERVCLLDQPFIKDPSITVNDLLKNKIAKIGENIKIRRFVRYEVGEGLEKREEDFAAEVAKQMGQ